MPLTRERSQARLPPWVLFAFVGLLLLAVLASPVAYAWFSPEPVPVGQYFVYGPRSRGSVWQFSVYTRRWEVGPFIVADSTSVVVYDRFLLATPGQQ